MVTKKKAKQPKKYKKPPQKRAKRIKEPKPHHIYEQLDKEYQKKFNEDAKKLDTKPERAVMGLSFTDYAEYKFLGADGVNDPFIQRNMGINIPKNYMPRMSTQPVNVTRDSKTQQLTIKPQHLLKNNPKQLRLLLNNNQLVRKKR